MKLPFVGVIGVIGAIGATIGGIRRQTARNMSLLRFQLTQKTLLESTHSLAVSHLVAEVTFGLTVLF